MHKAGSSYRSISGPHTGLQREKGWKPLVLYLIIAAALWTGMQDSCWSIGVKSLKNTGLASKALCLFASVHTFQCSAFTPDSCSRITPHGTQETMCATRDWTQVIRQALYPLYYHFSPANSALCLIFVVFIFPHWTICYLPHDAMELRKW